MTTLAERVAAGAAHLDQVAPGWVAVINLDELDLGSLDTDLAAQLSRARDYSAASSLTNGHDPELGFDVTDEQYLTLHGDGFKDAFSRLTDEWRRLIEARRAESTVA